MKKCFKSLFTIALAAIMVAPIAACDRGQTGGPGGDDEIREVDTSKSQLYVSNFNGGYGKAWLDKAIKRFESHYENESFESGKKGVQVHVENAKVFGSTLLTQVPLSECAVFFGEVSYYEFVNSGVVADITDVLTASLSEFGETGTIEDKLPEGSKTYYKTTSGKYYGIPTYEAYTGIMYDIELFEDKGFYFAADTSVDATTTKYNTDLDNGNGGLIIDDTDVRSNGPDGTPGTADDGLAATYDEFFILCDYIVESGCTPVIWTGEHRTNYVPATLRALANDFEGAEQANIAKTFNGTATNLVESIDDNGNVIYSEPLEITSENGYEMVRSAGRYYALDFYQKLSSNEDYLFKYNYTGTFSHTDAQMEFLFSRPEGNQPIAMLFDGTWWENESSNEFATLAATYGDEYSRKNRQTAMMPFPKPTQAEVGDPMTITPTLGALACVNAKAQGTELELAKKFLLFLNTDVSLREFTVTTNSPKGLNYTLTQEDLNNMSYFGKSLLTLKQTADIVMAHASTPVFIKNETALSWEHLLSSKIGTGTYNNPIDVIRGTNSDAISAKNYFNGIVKYHDANWWSKLN